MTPAETRALLTSARFCGRRGAERPPREPIRRSPRPRRPGWWLALVLPALVAASAGASAPPAFDARNNPFAFSGEYRDPSWPGIYLRARWYEPWLSSFVSRDPVAGQLNRYGYGGGNPIMRVDPSGRSYSSFQRGVARLDSGVGGHFMRFFLSPVDAVLQLAADPRGFWQTIRYDKGATDVFLFGGIAAEVLTSGIRVSFTGIVLPQASFWARVSGEAVLGVAQSALGSADSNLRHFRPGRFVDGLEYTFGPEVTGRIGAGFGYRPFGLHVADVDRMVAAMPASGAEERMLLFRGRLPLPHLPAAATWTTPWMEAAHVGMYHELLVAVSSEDLFYTQVRAGGLQVVLRDWSDAFSADADVAKVAKRFELQYVGVFDRSRVARAFRENPRNVAPLHEAGTVSAGERRPYRTVFNNCHHHASAVLEFLGVR